MADIGRNLFILLYHIRERSRYMTYFNQISHNTTKVCLGPRRRQIIEENALLTTSYAEDKVGKGGFPNEMQHQAQMAFHEQTLWDSLWDTYH
jgi:hypothetical protein